MKSLFDVAFIVVCVLTSVCVVDSRASPSDTLRIHVSNEESGLSFVIQDSMHTRILRNRMQDIKEMSSELKISEPVIFNHSTIGYNGLRLHSNGIFDPIIYNVFNRKITFSLSSVHSTLLSLEDFNSETEYLIAKVGLYEDLSTTVSGQEVTFSSLIPDEFKRVRTQYGVVTLEMLSDTLSVDFSMLDSRFSFIPPQKKRPIFNDIQITRALLSVTQYGFWISAPEGIARIKNVEPLLNSFQFESNQIDSILKSKIPLLDSLSSCVTSTQFSKYEIFSPDVHRSSFLIKTTDLGVVYVQPVSFYTGAIDRIAFLWVFSSDTTFDMSTLKKIFSQTATIQPLLTLKNHAADLPKVFITLSGRILPSSNRYANTNRGSGVYLQIENENNRPRLMIRSSQNVSGTGYR